MLSTVEVLPAWEVPEVCSAAWAKGIATQVSPFHLSTFTDKLAQEIASIGGAIRV
jgi:hypothetical protein